MSYFQLLKSADIIKVGREEESEGRDRGRRERAKQVCRREIDRERERYI